MRFALPSAPVRSCALVTAVLLAGCYHATVETGASPSAQTVRKSFASGWIYGLVPPSTVETEARCPNGVARVETRLSFVNQLVNILTLGIYTPMQIDVTCAAGPSQGAAPAAAPQTPPQPRVDVRPDDRSVPPGMNWVGDRRDRTYYPATCERALAIPPGERLYYPSEKSLQAVGYRRGDEC
jgi:hypothetical protein